MMREAITYTLAGSAGILLGSAARLILPSRSAMPRDDRLALALVLIYVAALTLGMVELLGGPPA